MILYVHICRCRVQTKLRPLDRRRTAIVIMLTLLVVSCAAPIGDKNPQCVHWADIGECESNPGFMHSECAASCAGASDDSQECKALVASGGCTDPDVALVRCRSSCYKRLRQNLTDDREGNWCSH